MSRLRRKVPNWVWDLLESLNPDEPMPTIWFVDKIRTHMEEIKASSHRAMSNKYWDLSPQGVAPMLRLAGFTNMGIDRSTNNTQWMRTTPS